MNHRQAKAMAMAVGPWRPGPGPGCGPGWLWHGRQCGHGRIVVRRPERRGSPRLGSCDPPRLGVFPLTTGKFTE